MKHARRRRTPEDWLDAALSAMERGGLDAVHILPLCAAVGASRGSFYWHFKDRAELLGRMLEHWERVLTDEVLERASQVEGDAEARLLALLSEVLERRRGRYEPAIRAWALHDRKVGATVRRVDRKRLTHLADLFCEMGFDSAEAGARARLTLAYLEGDHMIAVREPAAERRRFLELRHRLLTARGRS